MLNYLINIFLSIVPATHLFSFKRKILNVLNIKIGNKTSITNNIKIYGRGKIIIGNNCWIGISCQFHISSDACVKIGNNCDIAPDVKFITGTHEIGSTQRRAGKGVSGNIFVGDGSWIGVNSILLADVEIGSGTIIAAGSVVTAGKYPPNILLAGIPAKISKTYTT